MRADPGAGRQGHELACAVKGVLELHLRHVCRPVERPARHARSPGQGRIRVARDPGGPGSGWPGSNPAMNSGPVSLGHGAGKCLC